MESAAIKKTLPADYGAVRGSREGRLALSTLAARQRFELARRTVFFVNTHNVSVFTTTSTVWGPGDQVLDIRAEAPQFIMSMPAFSLLRVFEVPHTIDEALAEARIAPEHRDECRRWLVECMRRKILTVSRDSLVIFRRPDSDRVFFLYQGQNFFLMGHPLEFLKSTGIFKHNLVMFRDPNALFYHRGISREIPTYQAFVDWHRQFLADNPGLRPCCIGTSMGAYAAVQMGHVLRVPTVMAFALPVLENQFGVRNGMSDEHALWPQEWGENKQYVDYVNLPELLKKHNGATTYHLFYNEHFENDAKAARVLSQCPGFKLYPQDGDVHDVVRVMAAQGNLGNIADKF